MTGADALLLGAHLTATAGMVGLIWFVQVVHYPLFDRVGADRFTEYERSHQRRTSFVVGPLMGAEALTAFWILLAPPGVLGRTLPIVGVVLLGVIHLSTITLQVPAHERLARGHDPGVIRRLVRTNWIRTLGWTTRGAVAVAMLVVAAD